MNQANGKVYAIGVMAFFVAAQVVLARPITAGRIISPQIVHPILTKSVHSQVMVTRSTVEPSIRIHQPCENSSALKPERTVARSVKISVEEVYIRRPEPALVAFPGHTSRAIRREPVVVGNPIGYRGGFTRYTGRAVTY